MITTLIINFHTIQSHYMHVVTIPCTTSTLRYQRPPPREPVWTPVSQHCPLTLLYFPSRHLYFRFLCLSTAPPSLPPIFLRHFSFLKPLMTSFFVLRFSLYLLYPRTLFTRGLLLPVSLSTDADLPYPYLYRMFLAVFLVTHRTHIDTKILFSPLLSDSVTALSAFGVISVPRAYPRTDPIEGHQRDV